VSFPPPLRSGGNAAVEQRTPDFPSAPLRGEPGVRDRCPSGALLNCRIKTQEMMEEPDQVNIRLRQRSNFAVQHLIAAAGFSRQCGRIQQENAGKVLGDFYTEQIACVSATVMLSVASLESNINEYLENPEVLFSSVSNQQANEHVQLISNLSILDKYDRTLAFRECAPFIKGERPYQDVDVLISLRNELVHFHPEWHDAQDRHEKLGNKLRYKFELSPFITEETGVMFPHRIVSHGCTAWAVTRSLEFMEVFTEKMGMESKFAKFRSKLSS